MNVLPNHLPLEVSKLLSVKTNNPLRTLSRYSVRNQIVKLKIFYMGVWFVDYVFHLERFLFF